MKDLDLAEFTDGMSHRGRVALLRMLANGDMVKVTPRQGRPFWVHFEYESGRLLVTRTRFGLAWKSARVQRRAWWCRVIVDGSPAR